MRQLTLAGQGFCFFFIRKELEPNGILPNDKMVVLKGERNEENPALSFLALF